MALGLLRAVWLQVEASTDFGVTSPMLDDPVGQAQRLAENAELDEELAAGYAADAAAALAYAWDCLRSDGMKQHAVWSATRAYCAFDTLADATMDGDPLDSSIVRGELERQAEDLRILASDAKGGVNVVREAAMRFSDEPWPAAS